MVYQYIASTPGILGGKPCMKGTRIRVELILETVSNGASVADIMRKFPRLSTDAVQEAVRYVINALWSERIIDVDRAA
ncbi:DUF433 domain-containing protein [Spirosoma aerophilum]